MSYRMTRREYKAQLANTQSQQYFTRKLRKLRAKLPRLEIPKIWWRTVLHTGRAVCFQALTKSEARAQFKQQYGMIPPGQEFVKMQ